MHVVRSLSSLTSVADRLLRNRQIQASCTTHSEVTDHFANFFKPWQLFTQGFSSGPAAEPDNWQESGIRGAKAFDVSQFPQERARSSCFEHLQSLGFWLRNAMNETIDDLHSNLRNELMPALDRLMHVAARASCIHRVT